ncbi:MAG TPA: PA0069 family radical SAM protein [Gemmatimonadota bacterium]|nr:PA0069 family radical SAM protein [Gemmatimonadota bacterium]
MERNGSKASASPQGFRGRGTADNPPNRFLPITVERDDWTLAEDPAPDTILLRDTSRSILATNDSPDVGFDVSINPYRGCSHGCSYCYARPTHEYLGFSAGLDFETKILVKEDAAELLRAELTKRSWTPQPIAISGVTDAYQPAERRLRVTRACLEVLAEFRNPVVIVTKSHLVTRDIDLLGDLATHGAAKALLSVTTLDGELARKLEPRAAAPQRRLDAIRRIAEAGIPTGVIIGPVIPGLTDHELPGILEAAAAAGASSASYILLRLPHGVKELFADWLERHVPDRKEKVLGRVRDVRSGRLNDPRFRSRMRGEGPYAEQIRSMFEIARRRHGLDRRGEPLSTAAFRRQTPGGQGDLFAADGATELEGSV